MFIYKKQGLTSLQEEAISGSLLLFSGYLPPDSSIDRRPHQPGEELRVKTVEAIAMSELMDCNVGVFNKMKPSKCLITAAAGGSEFRNECKPPCPEPSSIWQRRNTD
jgi:hypothetical protein